MTIKTLTTAKGKLDDAIIDYIFSTQLPLKTEQIKIFLRIKDSYFSTDLEKRKMIEVSNRNSDELLEYIETKMGN